MLDLEITEGNTNMLEAEATGEIDPKRRWGTARFDDENVLLLTPRDDPANPLRIHLHNDMTLGRRHKDFIPDIDLSPFNAYDHGVSRQHAVLRRQNDTVIIVDLNSANNTFLNGQRLVPDQPRILRDGDEIRVGQPVLRVTFEDGF
ncbi:MAG: FHA domain-containing protein [Anaerolineales bacterium]